MAEIVWSPSALTDLDSIAEHIARDSVGQASLFIERIIRATDRLEIFPHSGRVIPELRQEDRQEIIYGSYRIMYRVVGDEVRITGIVHGARDWRP